MFVNSKRVPSCLIMDTRGKIFHWYFLVLFPTVLRDDFRTVLSDVVGLADKVHAIEILASAPTRTSNFNQLFRCQIGMAATSFDGDV